MFTWPDGQAECTANFSEWRPNETSTEPTFEEPGAVFEMKLIRADGVPL